MAGAISQPRQSCQFLFCLMKNPLLYRSAWPESSREASERFLMETLGRTQSERRSTSRSLLPISGVGLNCILRHSNPELKYCSLDTLSSCDICQNIKASCIVESDSRRIRGQTGETQSVSRRAKVNEEFRASRPSDYLSLGSAGFFVS